MNDKTKNLTIRYSIETAQQLDSLQVFISAEEMYRPTKNTVFLEAIWIVLEKYRKDDIDNSHRVIEKPHRYNFKLPLEAQDDFEELRLLMGERTNNGCAVRLIREALEIHQGEM